MCGDCDCGTTDTLIDVRAIAPRLRHPLIFGAFEGLAGGEHFRIVNDHDPRPLLYQFNAEYPGAFEWTYEQQGPEVWQVRIEKLRIEKLRVEKLRA